MKFLLGNTGQTPNTMCQCGKKQATRKILDIRSGPVIQLIKDLQQDAQSLSKHIMTATWQKNCFDNVSKTVPADSS